MKLSNTSVHKLKEILQKDYNKEVSDDEARKIGGWILKLCSHLIKDKENNSTKSSS